MHANPPTPPTQSARARHGAVLRAPGVAPIVLAAAVGRIPLGMSTLGTILVLRASGRGYGAAGIAVGMLALGTAGSQPLLGRLIDRAGVRRVLLPLSLGFGLAQSALALAGADRHAPLLAIFSLALASGGLLPPVGAAMRGIWPTLLPDIALRSTVFALEAVIQELGFLVGPPLVTLLTVLSSARTALLGAAVIGAVGALAFALLAGGLELPVRVRGARALASAMTRRVVLVSVALGIAFGAVEVALPAFCERHGARAAAGLMSAALSLGSVLGGALIGARAPARSASRRLAIALGAFGAAIVPLMLVDSIATMIVFSVFAGAPIAPAFAAQYVLLDRGGTPGAGTETFAWNSTAIFVGAAAGTAAGGIAVSAVGYRSSFALGALAVLAGALATRLWAARAP